MILKNRAAIIFRKLEKFYGKPKCALSFRSPWELLVATILSAQCTDERVNKVTPVLFERFQSVADYAGASQKEMERSVYSTGFYRNKARNIRMAARMILSKFEGRVPRTMDELLQLPGVARKTANVLLAVAYGVIEGVVVDTHVRRLALRMGLTREHAPEKIERDLMKLIPRKKWDEFSLLFITHGRRICTARRAFCEKCPVNHVCPGAFRVVRQKQSSIPSQRRK